MNKRLKKNSRSTKRNRLIVLCVIGLVLVFAANFVSELMFKTDESIYEPEVVSNYQPKPEVTQEEVLVETTEEKNDTPEPESTTEWPVTYSMEEANSLTVVVNKKHRLPSDYVPSLVSVAGGQMRPEAATAMQNLLNDASAAGAPMNIISSYRSYQTQVSTYQYWVDTQGQAQADRESARPGHSEHQTGLTADMGNPDGSCRLLACFGDGVAGQWLSANAHKYGFIIRYEDGKENLTGYIYEPWHLRYLGVDVATAVKNSGLTLDQYYGVEAGGY